jgi:hypothetical protein
VGAALQIVNAAARTGGNSISGRIEIGRGAVIMPLDRNHFQKKHDQLRYDDLMKEVEQSRCSNCGKSLEGEKRVFSEHWQRGEDWEPMEVYCPACIEVDPRRKKKITPHPSDG